MKNDIEDFYGRAESLRNECLLKTEELYVANRELWFSDFAGHFKATCEKIKQMQDESALPAISYLEYTVLYTRIINRDYSAQVRVYNEESYLDENQQAVCDHDVSSLFVHYGELWDGLMKLERYFVNTPLMDHAKTFFLDSLPSFYAYLTKTARRSMAGIVESGALDFIKKNDRFVISVGEYMAMKTPAYVEDRLRNAKKISRWFGKNLGGKYMFGDYSDLDFSGQVFQSIDFSYSRFKGSNLSRASLIFSSLVGANFSGANMEECLLNGCAIHEADFSDAVLRNANFAGAKAKTGLFDKSKWKHVGFMPASFRKSDLSGADFSFAILDGTDFSGANLAGASFMGATLTDLNFADATMDGAKFDMTQKDTLALSQEQLEAVEFIEPIHQEDEL